MLKQILIVDDSALTRKAIKRVLSMLAEMENVTYHEAANGREALEVIEANDIDLVLADLNMPEMTGVELIHELSKSEKASKTKVVVVSTESNEYRIKELYSQGVSNYLHKPFTPEDMKNILTEFVEV